MRTKSSFLDILDMPNSPYDAVCFPTHGVTKKNHDLVMGIGFPRRINERYHVADLFGELVHSGGNHCYYIRGFDNEKTKFGLINFPIRYKWTGPISDEILIRSCIEAKKLARDNHLAAVYIPVDEISEYMEIMNSLLDDRFILVSRRY